MTELDIKRVHRAVNRSGNGKVNREEFALAASSHLIKSTLAGETVPAPHENTGACLQLFQEFDRIERGSITKEELAAMCGMFGGAEHLSPAEIAELLAGLVCFFFFVLFSVQLRSTFRFNFCFGSLSFSVVRAKPLLMKAGCLSVQQTHVRASRVVVITLTGALRFVPRLRHAS